MAILTKILILLLVTTSIHADRIKDSASFFGVRDNQLIGYGLVVGLDGTGDNSAFSKQSFKTLLSRMGVTLPEGVLATSTNMASVVVHADLPAFAKPGKEIDITVSSIGDAKSLRGGTLLMTPLKGVDGKIYAMAQGNLVVGGFGIEGNDGSSIKVNVPVVGRIPGGAIVEVTPVNKFMEKEHISLLLKQPDFTTAKIIADTINQHIGAGTAQTIDSATIDIKAPDVREKRVRFISVIENLKFAPAEPNAKIIVNSRTGTIVVGKHVKVGAAAVSHGSLIVTIKENIQVDQALPDAPGGLTVVEEDSDIEVEQKDNRMFLFPEQVSLSEIVEAVNNVGAAPGDLMAILEALKSAGALRAELEVI